MQCIRSIFLSMILILCVACAGSVARGKQYFLAKDYQHAVPELTKAAKSGDAASQYALGYLYYYGHGVHENKQLAVYWMHRAAQRGSVSAVRALHLLKQND